MIFHNDASTARSASAFEFYDNNHLQGGCYATYNIALKDNDQNILAAMSFRKGEYNYKLLRFSCTKGIAVSGAASRLLTYFKKKYCKSGDKIISYCNRRWGNGNVYTKVGFIKSHEVEPGYYYIYKNGEYAGTRYQFQKHLLPAKLKIFDQNLSEFENMKANGYTRIWDCGQIAYELVVH